MSLDLDRLAAAKLWLTAGAGDLPYLSTAVYALQTVSCAQVPTASADTHWRLYVNPAWLALTPVPLVAAELAHLTWHLLAEHAERAAAMDVGPAEAGSWRTATDATVAETLTASGLAGHVLAGPDDLELTPGRSAEEHYARLTRLGASPLPDVPDGCGSAADGLSRAHDLPRSHDLGAVDEVQASAIRRRVAIEFRRHVTSRGVAPGDALRWVSHVLEPVVPWRQVLTAAVRRSVAWAHGHCDYTYSRPSRRQAASGRVILPATRRPLPTVAIVVDTSASMDDGLLAQALGEVDGAITGVGVPGTQVSVLGCDASAQAVQRVRRAGDLRLVGGGGTDLRHGIVAAAALRPRADVVVVLTDGYTAWPEHPPAGRAMVAAVLHRPGTHAPPTPAWCQRVLVPLG